MIFRIASVVVLKILLLNVVFPISLFGQDFSNRTFTTPVNFERAVFDSAADFRNVVFNSTVDFDSAHFIPPAQFGGSNFNDAAHFRGVDFYSKVHFEGMNFNAAVDFGGTNFYNAVHYFRTDFNAAAHFSTATFDSAANFSAANFYSDANFVEVDFNAVADFRGVTFNANVNFDNSEFDSSAVFVRTDFNSSADFRNVNFNERVYFRNADFKANVDFSHATFHSLADFSHATLNGELNFDTITLPDVMDFRNVSINEGEIDLTSAIIHSNKLTAMNNDEQEKPKLFLYGADISKFKIDFNTFDITFDKDQDTSHHVLLSTFEELLKRMEDKGYLDSREKLDIQYRNYKYDHAAERGGLSWFTNTFIKFFQNYWWNYGYAKEKVMYRTLLLLVLLSIVNMVLYPRLSKNIYTIDLCNANEANRKSKENIFEKGTVRAVHSIVYTSIFFLD